MQNRLTNTCALKSTKYFLCVVKMWFGIDLDELLFFDFFRKTIKIFWCGIFQTTFFRPGRHENFHSGEKKSIRIDRSRAVDIPTYSVFSETPSELRDMKLKKKSFFFSGCVNSGRSTFKWVFDLTVKKLSKIGAFSVLQNSISLCFLLSFQVFRAFSEKMFDLSGCLT